MSTTWQQIISNHNPARVVEIHPEATEPIEVYRDRYLEESPGGACIETCRQTGAEILDSFDSGSSVLLFGSGHSFWANQFRSHPCIAQISVMDFVAEAGFGLAPEIEFYQLDILKESIPGTFDYIYSAHTIEHFTREQVLQQVLPECLEKARKAVVFLVPFEEHWADDPVHKCLFYRGDELFSLADKYKIIRDGKELVLWFRGKGQHE